MWYSDQYLAGWGFFAVLNECRKMFNLQPSQAEDLIAGEALPYYLIEKHSENVRFLDAKEKNK